MISNCLFFTYFSNVSSLIQDKNAGEVPGAEVETYYSNKGRSLGACFPEIAVDRTAEPILWVAHSFFEAKKCPGRQSDIMWV